MYSVKERGDYSTYRVVLVVKTKMSVEELSEELENRNLSNRTDIPIVEHSKLPVYLSDSMKKGTGSPFLWVCE